MMWGLLAWGPWCWTCWTCGGAPDWPAQGNPNAPWVREAIEWRMKVGLNGCPEVVEALDAWTLDWLSASPNIHVDIQTSDWPFLLYRPELQSVLVQRIALDQLRSSRPAMRKLCVTCVTWRVTRAICGTTPCAEP